MVSTRSRQGKPLPAPREPGRAKYKPNDECKRHRLPDRNPKSVSVTSHSRRKPK